MTPSETAQQLRLAATIVETGHPWEYNHDKDFWQKSSGTSVLFAVSEGWPIRLTFATPPDGRALHNPDNLTVEQVGAGFRLALPDEKLNRNYEYWSSTGGWEEGQWKGLANDLNPGVSMRLPLSIPWPEVEKPEPTPKTVPFEPEDVPPGSVFRSKDQPATTFWTVSQVWSNGFYLIGTLVDWLSAERRMEINRSIPLTGRWNPSAWEPCHKILS